jgi:antitoxin component YwqK of YwqJK toxin-antitoxin module
MKFEINQLDSEGRPHGVWEYYYTNGTLWWRVHYHHDKQNGVWESYYEDGTLEWRRHYHHDMLKGISKWWSYQSTVKRKVYNLVIK